MQVRRGLLVSMCHHIAQLFLDWCIQRQMFNEPFTFIVPTETLETGALDPEYIGVMVTISPVKKRWAHVNITEIGIVNSIAATIGNKDWKPNDQVG